MRRILLVTLTFACLATAQRGPLVGEVRDANGEPIAGADVTLVGRPVPWVPELGEADVVRVQSGQDGRFRASLLATTTYSAFAVVERDGAWLASDVLDSVTAGALPVLRVYRPLPHRVLRVAGTEPWKARGPFRVRASSGGRVPFEVTVPVGEDSGLAELPPIAPDAHGSLNIDLLDGNGEVLQRESVAWSRGGREPPVFTVHAPIRVPARVTDPSGEPIAGAVVHYRSVQDSRAWRSALVGAGALEAWCEVGRTGADGTAELLVPAAGDPLAAGASWITHVFRASAPGTAESHSGTHNGGKRFVDGKELPATDEKLVELRFTLAPAEPLTGRILLAPDTPLVDHSFVVTAICKIANEGGWTHLPRRFPVTTDASGRFTVDALPVDAYGFGFLSTIPDGAAEVWNGDAERPPQRPPILTALWREPGRRLDLGTLDLSRTFDVRVTAFDAEMGPLRGGSCIVLPLHDDVRWIDPVGVWEFPLGAAGRVTLRLTEGPHLVLVVSDTGWAHAVVEVARAGHEIELPLTPLDAMPGRLVDPERNPIAGAQITLCSSSSSWADGRAAHEQAIDSLAGTLNHRMLRATTDADGRFVLRFLARENHSYAVQARIDGRQSDRVPVEASDEPVVILLR